jgi:hypothetical protein
MRSLEQMERVAESWIEIRVTASESPETPMTRGLFAKKRIPIHTRVCYYSGHTRASTRPGVPVPSDASWSPHAYQFTTNTYCVHAAFVVQRVVHSLQDTCDHEAFLRTWEQARPTWTYRLSDCDAVERKQLVGSLETLGCAHEWGALVQKNKKKKNACLVMYNVSAGDTGVCVVLETTRVIQANEQLYIA